MADAPASGAGARKGVGVQIPSSVPLLATQRRRAVATVLVPRWRNWYTRTFEGRMEQSIRVQVPAWALPSSPNLFGAWRKSGSTVGVPASRPWTVTRPPQRPLRLLGRLAQWLERLVYTEDVAGSNPAPPTIKPTKRSRSGEPWASRSSHTDGGQWLMIAC